MLISCIAIVVSWIVKTPTYHMYIYIYNIKYTHTRIYNIYIYDFCLLLPALRALFFMRGTPEYITSESAIDIRWFADGLTRSFEEIGFESHSKDA